MTQEEYELSRVDDFCKKHSNNYPKLLGVFSRLPEATAKDKLHIVTMRLVAIAREVWLERGEPLIARFDDREWTDLSCYCAQRDPEYPIHWIAEQDGLHKVMMSALECALDLAKEQADDPVH